LESKGAALYIDTEDNNWLGWPGESRAAHVPPAPVKKGECMLIYGDYTRAGAKEVISGAGPNAKISRFATDGSNHKGL